MVAESQNRWPSLAFDVQSVNGLFAPFLSAGFYYKTFMGPTRRAWMFYEHFIRKAAGLGRAGIEPDTDRYEVRHAFADVAIVGGGPAGLSAARAAAAGRRAGNADRAGFPARRPAACRAPRRRGRRMARAKPKLSCEASTTSR